MFWRRMGIYAFKNNSLDDILNHIQVKDFIIVITNENNNHKLTNLFSFHSWNFFVLKHIHPIHPSSMESMLSATVSTNSKVSPYRTKKCEKKKKSIKSIY